MTEQELQRQVFKRLYLVTVPRAAVYADSSTGYVPLNVINGRKSKIDPSEPITVHLPIYRLAEIAETGHWIKLLNHKEVVDMYQVLKTYVERERHHVNVPNAVPEYDEHYDRIFNFAKGMTALNVGQIVNRTFRFDTFKERFKSKATPAGTEDRASKNVKVVIPSGRIK